MKTEGPIRKQKEERMDQFIHYYKKIILRVLLMPLRIMPIKQNRVFMHNDLAYNYSCNPKYVTEYLLKKYPAQFEIIISTKYPDRYKYLNSKGRKVVKFNSFLYFFYAMTSKVFLTNSGGFSYIPMRKSQILINTHHGGGAYKKIGRYVYGDTPIFRKDLLLSANLTTVFLSTCRRFTEVVSDSLLVPKEKFWEIGMPRNDILIQRNEEEYRRVREKIGLKEGEYLVLYAPTYRKTDDNYFKDSISICYGIDCNRVCADLSKRFGGKWVFGFRFHPCVTNRDQFPEGNIIDLSDYEEMQELLLAADVMINDFSSSMWDYMLTGRPSFMFAVDMEHYIATTDVETPVSEWPFPKSTNNDELEHSILNFDEEKYKKDCEEHYRALGGCESGRATEMVGDYIYKTCFKAGAGETR